MGVKVAFHDAQPGGGGNRAVGVPKAALQKLEGRDIVLVVRNGRLERRAVTVGAAGQDPATILAGLAAGEKVVLGASPTLGENQRVRESKD
jgi:hypothetical protein